MTAIMDIMLSFLTLTILEIILGIDNLVFLAIISQKLPQAKQTLARRLGLFFACVMRLILLALALELTKLVTPLFTLFDTTFTGKGLFLLAGGIFLLTKATHEIHLEIDSSDNSDQLIKARSQFGWVVMQIVLLDIVFSLDSILTAVGLTQNFWLMAASIVTAILIMLFASEPVTGYINRHPSLKMLALGFLILIATVLIADGLNFHIPRGYLYFAISFSLFIEVLNLSKKRKRS